MVPAWQASLTCGRFSQKAQQSCYIMQVVFNSLLTAEVDSYAVSTSKEKENKILPPSAPPKNQNKPNPNP